MGFVGLPKPYNDPGSENGEQSVRRGALPPQAWALPQSERSSEQWLDDLSLAVSYPRLSVKRPDRLKSWFRCKKGSDITTRLILPAQKLLRITPLFESHKHLRTAVDAILEGHCGTAVANASGDLAVAMLTVGPFTFLGGGRIPFSSTATA